MHVIGAPTKIWTGTLPEDVAEGSAGDTRICWHVVFPWGDEDGIAADLRALLFDNEDNRDTNFHELPPAVKRSLAEIIMRFAVGWANVTDAEGNPVPLTAEAILRIEPLHVFGILANYSAGTAQVREELAAKKA